VKELKWTEIEARMAKIVKEERSGVSQPDE